ncbi:cupin domain-containing protein [Achromobacter sp. ESBL13]|uniref:cupin domain-containing protein n=1 Tax=Achromobacter sp. ESBL13 TaxID=3077328 RepID=UPI002FC7F55F
MSKLFKLALPVALVATGALLGHAPAQAAPAEPIVTELMTKPLPDIPGKDALMITVDYPPGAADPIHRHDAYSFVYVLQGSIIMQVKGGKEVTLTPGQTFFEGPDDVHTVGRNASQTEPAKFVVVLIKKKGAPALIPVH